MNAGALLLFVLILLATRYVCLLATIGRKQPGYRPTWDDMFASHLDPLSEFIAVGFTLWLPASIVAAVYNYDALLCTCVVVMIALGVLSAYESESADDSSSQ